jgi:hypothetical protein
MPVPLRSLRLATSPQSSLTNEIPERQDVPYERTRHPIALGSLPILDAVKALCLLSDEYNDDVKELLDDSQSTCIGEPEKRDQSMTENPPNIHEYFQELAGRN